MRQGVGGLAADGAVVVDAEELLERDDVGTRGCRGDAAGDLGYALSAKLGDVLETPDVEG